MGYQRAKVVGCDVLVRKGLLTNDQVREGVTPQKVARLLGLDYKLGSAFSAKRALVNWWKECR